MTDPSQEKPALINRGCLLGGFLLGSTMYILAPVPLTLVLMRLPPNVAQIFEPVYRVVFAPIDWGYHNINFVKAFYDWQFEIAGVL